MSAKPNPKPADLGPLDYYTKVPSSKDGEFVHAAAVPADLNALSFSETARSPYDGDESRSQGKFRTTDSKKRS
jgi:hypothetical protein